MRELENGMNSGDRARLPSLCRNIQPKTKTPRRHILVLRLPVDRVLGYESVGLLPHVKGRSFDYNGYEYGRQQLTYRN